MLPNDDKAVVARLDRKYAHLRHPAPLNKVGGRADHLPSPTGSTIRSAPLEVAARYSSGRPRGH
jgi:hypothetical protein